MLEVEPFKKQNATSGIYSGDFRDARGLLENQNQKLEIEAV